MKIHYGSVNGFWAMCGQDLEMGRDGVVDLSRANTEEMNRITCGRCLKSITKDKRERWDANTSATPVEKKSQP